MPNKPCVGNPSASGSSVIHRLRNYALPELGSIIVDVVKR